MRRCKLSLAVACFPITFVSVFSYRSELQTLPELEIAKGCVPHLGIHLSDLTRVEEGNPDQLSPTSGTVVSVRGDLINVAKLRMIADHVLHLRELQDSCR